MTDFIQARNYTAADRSKIRLLVVHTMENPEKPGTARATAKWFAGPLAPQASAHACVDNNEFVLCVQEKDVAWAAPGANRDGYHIEHAGYARQDSIDWADPFSTAMLKLSAAHAADIANRYGIPVRKLTVDEVRDKSCKGFCGHADVTAAFHLSDHTDPGAGFPWDFYLSQVNENMLPGEVLDAMDEVPNGQPGST